MQAAAWDGDYLEVADLLEGWAEAALKLLLDVATLPSSVPLPPPASGDWSPKATASPMVSPCSRASCTRS